MAAGSRLLAVTLTTGNMRLHDAGMKMETKWNVFAREKKSTVSELKRLESKNAWKRLHCKSFNAMSDGKRKQRAHFITLPAARLINNFSNNGFYLKIFRSGNCISIRLEALILYPTKFARCFAVVVAFSSAVFSLFFIFSLSLIQTGTKTRTHAYLMCG